MILQRRKKAFLQDLEANNDRRSVLDLAKIRTGDKSLFFYYLILYSLFSLYLPKFSHILSNHDIISVYNHASGRRRKDYEWTYHYH